MIGVGWREVGQAFAILVGFATVLAALFAWLQWRDGRTHQHHNNSEHRNPTEDAAAGRRDAVREEAVLRAVRASTVIAAAAGRYVEAELRRQLSPLGRLRPPTSTDDLKTAVEMVSQSLDELRYLGPAGLAEAMSDYFDRVIEVQEAAVHGTGDVSEAVNAAGRRMYEAKVRLVEVATATGLDPSTAVDRP